MQVVEIMGQDMVIYRPDNGVGTVKSKVGFTHASRTHVLHVAFIDDSAVLWSLQFAPLAQDSAASRQLLFEGAV